MQRVKKSTHEAWYMCYLNADIKLTPVCGVPGSNRVKGETSVILWLYLKVP